MRAGLLLACAAVVSTILGCGPSRVRGAVDDAGAAGAPYAPAPDGGGGVGGTTTSFPAAAVSGTRLRLYTWVTADGMRRPDTIDGTARGQIWYDTQLETLCTFAPVDDVGLACVPLQTYGDPGNIFFNLALAFLDAGCQGERVAAEPPFCTLASCSEAACGAKRYATLVHEGAPSGATIDSGSGNDNAGLDLFELGPPLGATPVFTRAAGEGATCAPPAADSPNHYYRLGRRLAASELVRGHVETVSTGHRISFVSIIADDGARQRIGWHDTALDADCSIGLARDGQPRCLPNAPSVTAFPEVFADADCHTPVFFSPGGEAFVTTLSGDFGLEPGGYYRAGAEPKQLFSDTGTGCVSLGAGVPGLLTLSDEIPPGAFDAFAETTIATARFEMVVHVDRDGAIEPFPISRDGWPPLTDTKTHERCDLARAADGKTRCLPGSPSVRYTSPACGATPGAGIVSVLGDPPPYASTWSGDACTGGLALSLVGKSIPATGAVWDTTSYGDFCVANPLALDDPSLEFYAVGAAEPSSNFEQAAPITE